MTPPRGHEITLVWGGYQSKASGGLIFTSIRAGVYSGNDVRS